MKTFVAACALALLMPLAFASAASASATVTVPLGVTDSFALLGAFQITDVPTSVVNGDVGLSPASGTGITGLTCAEVTGTIYSVDAAGPLPCRITNPGTMTTATSNLNAAYLDAFGRLPDTTFATADNQLGGQTLVPGVYRFGHATTANLDGNLTLSGNADAVWIFQATSDLVTAASSTVTLTGGAQSCNVFWQVGSTATLHTSSTLRGTVLANNSILVDASVTVDGRLFAGAVDAVNGKLTLINDTITKPAACVTQASIDSAAAAVAAAQAAAAQAAADQAVAAAKAAELAAAAAALAKVTAEAQAALQAATAAKAAAAKTAAVAAKVAAAKAAKTAAVARAAAHRAATAKRIALKLSTIRKARTHAGFTG